MKIYLPTVALALASAISAQAAPVEKFSTESTEVQTKTVYVNPAPSAPSTRSQTIVVRPGEIAQVFVFTDQFGVPRESFYVPSEGTRVVQLYMERSGRSDRWYVKGLSRGRTVGGVVPRSWLDSSGFKPKSMGDEMRIQAEIKAHPIYIEVQ